ncbi:MAG: thioredoxin family protein, partial [Segatella oris]
DVKVSAVWDEKKNNISVTSETIFRIDMAEAPYALAYVLTADELQHSSYYQKNYYSGSTADLGITKEMDFFINSPRFIHGMEFNHVAISAMGIDTGLTGSLKPSAVADEVQTHKVSFNNISQYRTIQDKSKLHVCVLVINTKTKEIVNADQCTISDSATTGIDSMADAGKAVETARYDAAGRRISHPTRGLNIVKYSDGHMVKELVK